MRRSLRFGLVAVLITVVVPLAAVNNGGRVAAFHEPTLLDECPKSHYVTTPVKTGGGAVV